MDSVPHQGGGGAVAGELGAAALTALAGPPLPEGQGASLAGPTLPVGQGSLHAGHLPPLAVGGHTLTLARSVEAAVMVSRVAA